MDKAAFDDYVETRYKKQMEFYSKASAKNQDKYKRFQWILIVLSALTPVLAALNGITWLHEGKTYLFTSQLIQILVVIVSSFVAILTTALKTFQYQELWANYRTTYEQLKPEIHYYDFSVGPYGAPDINKESLFVSRVETLLNKERLQWFPAKRLQNQPGDHNYFEPIISSGTDQNKPENQDEK
jgi:hypothetical protein